MSNISAGVDDVGCVTRSGNRILREIRPAHQVHFRGLLQNKSLLDELNALGLVATTVAESTATTFVLEHELVERQSYWNEWSFEMLKDAALLTVRLTRRLLREGMGLKDAHPYNVLFKDCRPVFVDFGSIVPWHPKYQKAWQQSFHAEFLLPLLSLRAGSKRLAAVMFRMENRPALKALMGKIGVRLPPWNGIFPQQEGFAVALETLERWLLQLRPNSYATVWEDYYSRGQLPQLAQEDTYTNKERSALRCLEKTRADGGATLLDIASNEGWFARLAASRGFRVVAFDYDERAINNLYNKPAEETKGILPLVMNFMKPTPSHGMGDIWPNAQGRLACDVTLAMAIVHHLALGQGMAFDQFANRLREFTGKFAIVEFIGPDDIHIQKKARRVPWYNEQGFVRAMERHFILREAMVSEPGTRKVMLFAVRS